MRTDRLQREYGVTLRWRVFPLHPETPEEGMELSELYPGREEEVKVVQARLRQLAAAEGLLLSERISTSNSRRAQELGKWAEALGKGDLFRKAVYQAYFVEGGNIAKLDELERIAEAVGLSGDEAGAVLMAGSFAAAVDADWERAGELRIRSVPSHICDGNRLVGFSSYDDFERLIGQRR